MGASFFFFVESKSFEFCVEEGGSFFSLCIFERGRYSLRFVFMSKEGAKRLLSLLEDFISSKPPGHFARTVRDGETVLILQLGFNAHGYFLMLSEFLRGCRKGFIVVPKGNLGCGWRGFGSHLRKALAPGTLAFNLSPKAFALVWTHSLQILCSSGSARPAFRTQNTQAGSGGEQPAYRYW